MRKFTDWVIGWYVTWRIKKQNPGLYEFLKHYKYDSGDFEEAGRPEDQG